MDWESPIKKLWSIANRLNDQELRETLTDLERAVREEGERNLQYSPPAYWTVEGDKKEGPFCQVCWDTHHRLIRLQAETSSQMVCKVCGNRYGQEESSPFTFNPPF